MKERPILFSAPMVRALLDGSKTQTRRVVNQRHLAQIDLSRGGCKANWSKPMPYGQPGDRLWVRETHCQVVPRYGSSDPSALYRADLDPGQQYLCVDRWTPAIHMPRNACRITLEVTGVRVERLRDISETDALAEGIDQDTCAPVAVYRDLWESINGYASWDLNPWVWAVEFKKVTA